MNKMFKRIESQLKIQEKTKVWFADSLGESTQNINNWKKRGVPAAKVKRIAVLLGLSREYLEGGEGPIQGVAAPKADYMVNVNSPYQINYTVFVDVKDNKVAKLLQRHLKTKNDLSYLYCEGWSYADPFIGVDIWQGKQEAPTRVLLRQDCIVGITDYNSSLHSD